MNNNDDDYDYLTLKVSKEFVSGADLSTQTYKISYGDTQLPDMDETSAMILYDYLRKLIFGIAK